MLNSIIQSSITVQVFLACTAVSAALGLLSALLCKFKNQTSQSFLITIAMLPAIVQMIIMLVNGNIGAGVAVAGAFGLVRFRSAPGTAREITAVFMAMALGLATGMGYIGLAALFFTAMALFQIALAAVNFGTVVEGKRDLRITIPENLDYEGIFDDLFEKYTKMAKLESVKTSNLGTLYELRYEVTLKGESVPKAFLDEIRTRNGNLNIVCGRMQTRDAL
ncbi:MAG: DUF4956 domain-containing protein [Lachnospiraceae bacterium]|nr:DUF4956 domain-containing protein [Lachnospiraceae bacterium]MDY5741819.1 DUF4956 domain-containing protein [Lachnospiraceae bacterium]